MPTDIRKIKKLIELLETSGIAEIEIKEGEDSVRISRHPQSSASSAPMIMVPPGWATPGYGPPSSGPMPAPVTPAAAPANETETLKGHVLHAPMVGTFYRKPAPDAPNFVDVGSTVSVGQTVCIIEAMKVMNEIKAEKSGTICEIIAEDGTAVQFGDPLFRIK